MKKKEKAKTKKVKRQGKIKVTPLQEAKRPAGEFMSKFDMLMLDRTKGGSGAANSFARDEHEDLFGKKAVGIHIAIVKARVCYELIARGYKEHNVEDQLPKNLKQNLKAAMDNNIDGFSPDVKELIQLTMKSDEQTKKKARVRKDKAPKVKKPREQSAQGYAAEILWGNNKTKHKDEKIQKMILKKFPKAPPAYRRLSTVRNIRNRLNTGFIKKYGVPKKEIKEFE